MVDDLINWESIKTPTKSSDEKCPNCKSRNTRLQQKKYELNNRTCSNIHCADCGWGWTYYHDGHADRREGLSLHFRRKLGTVDFEQINDSEEKDAWHQLLNAVEVLSDFYGIDYPLETFEE